MNKWLLPIFLLGLSACSDHEIKPLEIRYPVNVTDSEKQDLSYAAHRLAATCYNVFSKPESFSGVSVSTREASPEQKIIYGWHKVSEVSLTLDNHPDFGKAIRHNCSFHVGDGRRTGVVAKSSCMEDACRFRPLEDGAGWGKFYEFN
ncbi:MULTISPECIES: hypothetical protein [unclassified Neisseria]|uniref:hypothetical protein n=1 Tax=unclassified Neisseria TaxID=2623750 RepID=UPI0010728503|nr:MULTISPECIES: hypothetical protein [unclassified Neisseria]MBF0804311.1 hypothetical protein [Neisseria sp. 19428wB4_WF04]TFU42937.1 hypothetical protein E4T99_08135 [Neisseria sp. WF04]